MTFTLLKISVRVCKQESEVLLLSGALWKEQGFVKVRGWQLDFLRLIYLCLAQILMTPKAVLKFYFKHVTFKISSHIKCRQFHIKVQFSSFAGKNREIWQQRPTSPEWRLLLSCSLSLSVLSNLARLGLNCRPSFRTGI